VSLDRGSPKAPRTVRLRLPTGWTVLPVGDYEIGRSHSCHVMLDGSKVSRLHARLRVESERVWLEDLGSSNGCYVNGQRVSGSKHPLSDGDVMVIGDFELALSLGSNVEDQREAPSLRPTLVDAEPGVLEELEPSSTSKSAALDLLGSVAERAIAVGDAVRAESILRNGLSDVLVGARAGENIDPNLRHDAIRLSLALARALPAASWFEYALDLLSVLGVLPTEMQALDLEQSVSAVPSVDARKLAAYASVVHKLPSSIEKMRTLHRLEAMTQVARGNRG
jgi:FHA domain